MIDLKNALNELREQKQVYSELQEFVSTRPDNLSYDLVLDYGIVENEATIKWLEKSIKRNEGVLLGLAHSFCTRCDHHDGLILNIKLAQR